MQPAFREATERDAESLLSLKRELDVETHFMLLSPGERAESLDDVAGELARISKAANSVIVVSELEDQMVGYLEATGGKYRRNHTTAEVVLGVLTRASGNGIGSGLLEYVEEWSSAHSLHRLELTVMEHNQSAISLYQRAGYVLEGRHRERLLVDGRFIDELSMAKIISRTLEAP